MQTFGCQRIELIHVCGSLLIKLQGTIAIVILQGLFALLEERIARRLIGVAGRGGRQRRYGLIGRRPNSLRPINCAIIDRGECSAIVVARAGCRHNARRISNPRLLHFLEDGTGAIVAWGIRSIRNVHLVGLASQCFGLIEFSAAQSCPCGMHEFASLLTRGHRRPHARYGTIAIDRRCSGSALLAQTGNSLQ